MDFISADGLPRTAACEPLMITVEPGKVYSWCSCGLTANEPFCDSAHKNVIGMPFRSVKVKFEKAEEVYFCRCKKTSTPPFCDGTHNRLASS